MNQYLCIVSLWFEFIYLFLVLYAHIAVSNYMPRSRGTIR